MVKNEKRCENCVHYAKAVRYTKHPKTWLERHNFKRPEETKHYVDGKGICMEPSVFAEEDSRPLVVLDMAVCSLFSAKAS